MTRKRIVWLAVAEAVLLAVIVALIAMHRRQTVAPPVPQESSTPPAQEIPVAAEPEAAGAASENTAAGDIDRMLTEKAREETALLAQRRNRMSPGDVEKVRRIIAGMKDNFARIKTVKFHMTETRQEFVLSPGDAAGPEITAKEPEVGSDLDAEFTREPLYVRLVGTSGKEPLDTTITPAGTVDKGRKTRSVEQTVTKMTDMGIPTGIEAMLRPESPTSFSEDQPVDADLLAVAAAKGIGLSADARYDILAQDAGDFGSRSVWINRETGLVDFTVSRKRAPRAGENPFWQIGTVIWRKVGDVYYVEGYDNWSGFDQAAKQPAADFTVRMQGRVSRLEVNGVKGD